MTNKCRINRVEDYLLTLREPAKFQVLEKVCYSLHGVETTHCETATVLKIHTLESYNGTQKYDIMLREGNRIIKADCRELTSIKEADASFKPMWEPGVIPGIATSSITYKVSSGSSVSNFLLTLLEVLIPGTAMLIFTMGLWKGVELLIKLF